MFTALSALETLKQTGQAGVGDGEVGTPGSECVGSSSWASDDPAKKWV